MKFDPTVYRELQKLRDKIPKNTYKTILGQLRAGDSLGAALGIKRMQREIAKAEQKKGGGSMKFKTCPNCGAHLDHGEQCDCVKKQAAEKAAASAGQHADRQPTDEPKMKHGLMPGA